MNNQFEKVEAARYYLSQRLGSLDIDSTIITGTGLGEIWKDLKVTMEIPYGEIPHFPKSTVRSHSGIMYVCQVSDLHVIICAGRFHYYEGYDASEIAFQIRVLHALGIKNALFTNASGSVNSDYQASDIVGIRDHINMQPDHTLRGFNEERWGPRFPDMIRAYNMKHLAYLNDIAQANNIRFHKGVYLALQGPSLETPAEYEMLHRMGADLVGMSTVPEVIAAKHLGMSVTAISVVSNVCYPIETLTETSLDDVIDVVGKAIPSLSVLVLAWLSKISQKN